MIFACHLKRITEAHIALWVYIHVPYRNVRGGYSMYTLMIPKLNFNSMQTLQTEKGDLFVICPYFAKIAVQAEGFIQNNKTVNTGCNVG